MRIICFGYRCWAKNIYKKIKKTTNNEIIILDNRDLVNINLLKLLDPAMVLFYGWSWFVPIDIIKKYKCFMLHPSDLPRYRGGSPIQNQIIDGLSKTKICLFQMTKGMDEGPIYGKRDLDLSGEVKNIFKRLEELGLELTNELLDGVLNKKEQDNTGVYYCKRRTPDQSEITISDFTKYTGEEIYNKIRCLTDPYPNAFIRTIDGKRLCFKSVELKKD